MNAQQSQRNGAPVALAVMSLCTLAVLISFLLPEPLRDTVAIDSIVVGGTAPVLALINDFLIPLIYRQHMKGTP